MVGLSAVLLLMFVATIAADTQHAGARPYLRTSTQSANLERGIGALRSLAGIPEQCERIASAATAVTVLMHVIPAFRAFTTFISGQTSSRLHLPPGTWVRRALPPIGISRATSGRPHLAARGKPHVIKRGEVFETDLAQAAGPFFLGRKSASSCLPSAY